MWVSGAGVLLLMLLIMTAGGQATGAPVAAGMVTLYASIPQEIATDFARTFMAKYPSIKVEVLRAGAVEIERRIFAEVDAGGIRADLLWLSDAPVFLTLRDAGHLQVYRSPEAIPVRRDVAPPPALPRPADIKTLPFSYEWAAATAAEIRTKFEEIMLR